MSRADAVICADLGSTFTKALLVELTTGTVVARAEHRTTLAAGAHAAYGASGPAAAAPPAGARGDVLDGLDACRATLAAADPHAADADVLACSSAGGGLRIAVLGNEPLVTAEAGRRVALSSGGRVVAVASVAGDADPGEVVRAALPDVVLLTGGTDGGNREALVTGARSLAAAGWPGPVVVAGNVDAHREVAAALGAAPRVLARNVVPRIGVLDPDGARSAIRDVFVSHVIGGKRLTSPQRREELERLVQGATPDVVLRGVELLAQDAGDVVVVDVGGATTDVHAVVEVDPEEAGLAREVVAVARAGRTVEGDLGMRWSAPSTVDHVAGLAPGADIGLLRAAAARRAGDPSYLPTAGPDREAELDVDETLACTAATVALRRHAGRSRVVLGPDGRVVERTGRDLREVRLVVGSGGVLRHGRRGVADRVLAAALGPAAAAAAGGGWQVPESPRVVVDRDYVLAAVGLLAGNHPRAARQLARTLLDAATGLS